MTVTGPDDLYALANSSGFDHIKALRLYAVDDASLYYFGRFSPLLQRPQPPTLSLIIQQNDIATRQGAEILRGLPLAGLKLICLHNLNHHTVEALKNASYPIELVGIFSNAELASLARIPMLTALDSASEKFSDEAVALMATHPALQTLSIRAFQTMSDMGIQRLAGMPQLTQLSLYETDYMSSRMTATGVIALAACKTLTSLRIRTSVTPLSENSVVALSSSTSLQTLDISIGPGVGHLANLATLQDLVLRGQCLGSRALDVASARALGRMSHLKSLSIANARIDPTALTAFVEHSRIGTLHLQDVLLGQDAVSAMVNNHHLTTLTLQTVVITAEQIVALSSHPTLEKLRINHTDYRPQHQFDRTIAYV